MGMVTEMHLPGGGGEPGTRFNYRGMHRYLITLLGHPACGTLADRETVIPTLDILRGSCRAHGFEVYAYYFLPDRLALLVRGKEEGADMKLFLAAFRTASGSAFKQRTGKRLWSKKYQERVLRKTEVTRAIAEEVFRLPVKAGLATATERYMFQGSFVLAGVPPPPAKRSPSRPRAGKIFRKSSRN
jgi:REP element-mobilizing transposase RayT